MGQPAFRRPGRSTSIAALALLMLACVHGCAGASAQQSRIDDSFEGPNGLISAEGHPATDGSPWDMTSGSLFRVDGTGWSGQPDSGQSPGQTGSAVFRMVSVDHGFADLEMSVNLRVDQLTETDRTPAQDYDGVHVWVRYQSDRQLYAVSVDRRDATMVIKKKCDGGTDNGGTYYDLSSSVPNTPIPLRLWQHIMVSVQDQSDGSVAISAARDGVAINAVDNGIGCPPLRGNGAVGIRGDNTEFSLADITVEPMGR